MCHGRVEVPNLFFVEQNLHDLGLRNCGLLPYYYLQLYIDKQRLSLVIYLYYSAKSKSSNKCRCCNSTCSSPTSMKVIQCALSSGGPGLQESLQKNVLNYFVCITNKIASVTTEETLAYIILCLKLNLENHKFMQPLLYCIPVDVARKQLIILLCSFYCQRSILYNI